MRRNAQQGFTLFELLVVIALIALLAGLTIMIGPALQRSEKAARGGANVQATLFIAKQTALRDQVLYGVRLLPDGNGNFNALQYITQPGDYVRNRVQVVANDTTQVQFETDITDGLADPTLWPIQLGDYLQIQSNPTPTIIISIVAIKNGTQTTVNAQFPQGMTATGVAAPDSYTIQTQSQNSGPTASFTSDFRVMRMSRPVSGEEIVQLPDDVIIDGARSLIGAEGFYVIDTTKVPPVPALVRSNYDILFTPPGPVTGVAARSGKIVLWVRDINDDPTVSSNQALITIFPRSGAIASYEVNTAPGEDPYAFTYDPRPNGF
jgi:prepilin-type N-terminal cleavage/methylation domain-containing protein